MCTPPPTDDDRDTDKVTARNLLTGTGPGRPTRAGCGSGTWLDSPEGRMWENVAGSRRRPDRPRRP